MNSKIVFIIYLEVIYTPDFTEHKLKFKDKLTSSIQIHHLEEQN